VSDLVVANIASNCSGKASSRTSDTTIRNFPITYRKQVLGECVQLGRCS
jgi:hypothetical protein